MLEASVERERPLLTCLIPLRMPDESGILEETCWFWSLVSQEQPWLEVLFVVNGASEAVRSEFPYGSIGPDNVVFADVSRSKAENLNLGVDVAKGRLVGIFDADSRPDLRAARHVLSRMLLDDPESFGVAGIQGAKVVPPPAGLRDLAGAMVRIESLINYYYAAQARYKRYGSTFFAGSNGFFHTEVLRRFRFSTEILVEDIDLSARLARARRPIHYSPELPCLEQSPPSIGALYAQRRRWFYGWRQVARTTGRDVVRSRSLPLRTRIMWLSSLVGQLPVALFIAVSTLVFSGVLGWHLAASAGATLLALSGWVLVRLLLASRLIRASSSERVGRADYLSVILVPLYYCVLLAALTSSLVAAPRRWQVTPRRVKGVVVAQNASRS